MTKKVFLVLTMLVMLMVFSITGNSQSKVRTSVFAPSPSPSVLIVDETVAQQTLAAIENGTFTKLSLSKLLEVRTSNSGCPRALLLRSATLSRLQHQHPRTSDVMELRDAIAHELGVSTGYRVCTDKEAFRIREAMRDGGNGFAKCKVK